MRLSFPIAPTATVRDAGRPAEVETAAAVREATAGNTEGGQRRAGEQAPGELLPARERAAVAKLRVDHAEIGAHEAALAGLAPEDAMRRARDIRAAALGAARMAATHDVGTSRPDPVPARAAAAMGEHHHHDGSVCPQCEANVRRYAANVPLSAASDSPSE